MNQNNTILIVDDEKIGRDVLKGLLTNQGYDLHFATGGKEAIDKAKELTPDLILLDVMMPDIDGFDVCRSLRSDPILAEVPIIMITAMDNSISLLQGIEAGADDFMGKTTFDRLELQARVRTITRLNRYRRSLKASRELESKIAQLSALYEISRIVNSDIELDSILRVINQKVVELMNVDFALIFFYNNEKMKFYIPPFTLGARESEFCSDINCLSIATNVAELAYQEGKAILIHDLDMDKNFNKYLNRTSINNDNGTPIKSILCMPLQGKESIIGVIEVINKKDDEFTEDDKQMLEAIADNIALSIERANLYQELQKAEILLRRQNAELKLSVKQKYGFENIIGNADKMIELLTKAKQVALTDSTVLIYGDTGTGKELLAQAIHQVSPRSHKNFVPINCGAIPKELLESELFGHEKGSFTGAIKRRIGRFEEANGGTLFLDEIGDMPLELQVRLLRVLQEGLIQRLGGNANVSVDVRIIAATHRNLTELVLNGTFREDLYYRLKVFTLEIPPLSERKSDLPLLISHFISHYSERFGKHIEGIDDPAMNILYSHDYPGNIRELQHIIESAVIICKGKLITAGDLPKDLQISEASDKNTVSGDFIPSTKEELSLARIAAQDRVERLFLTKLLSDNHGNISEAARKAGMNRSWITEMVGKHKINLDQYKNDG